MRVSWTKVALNHLEELQDYVAQESPAAAYRLASALVERTEQGLASTPRMGRKGRALNTRELIFSDLPYIVVYRLTDIVEIVAIIHAARKWPETFD